MLVARFVLCSLIYRFPLFALSIDQNNLQELWALLNFLLPEIFSSSSDFDEMFSAAQTDANVSTNLLAQLHKVLRPFMLRRLKSQVATDLPPKKETLLFVGMSEMQTKLYKGILEKDIEAVMGRTTQKSRLMNMVMQLRKAANHPYLFEGVEDRSLPAYGDHLIYTSGKMSVMDKLLARFKQQGSRVLIFSQMTRTLDIMEDYCLFRQFNYCRIDGATAQEDRETMMRDFNAEGSDKFLFLLSTRAGGLGINLNTADIVILYDSDWNPQVSTEERAAEGDLSENAVSASLCCCSPLLLLSSVHRWICKPWIELTASARRRKVSQRRASERCTFVFCARC